MDDTISRQAAIAAIQNLYPGMPKVRFMDNVSNWQKQNEQYIACEETIRKLPSAQPETHDKRTETHACDYISRQAAIDALMTILDRPNHAEFLYTDEICEVLNNLPSAQQWIPVTEEEVFQAGYEGREIRFRVNGRLFAIRELAQ